jgi:hypothetical protein
MLATAKGMLLSQNATHSRPWFNEIADGDGRDVYLR